MNFEPQKFFIGLMEFFTILLPGALLTYLFSDQAGASFFKLEPVPGGVQGWILFLFGSYLLGHFVFLFGSWLLDDDVYDRIRSATFEGQVRKLAAGKARPGPLARRLADWLLSDNFDITLRHALAIKQSYVDEAGEKPSVNAFQWSKARLALNHPEATSSVERFEADSKFFRSLIIVLLIVGIWNAVEASWTTALACVLLLPLALWRYVDQRAKSINQAFYLVITKESDKAAGTPRITPRDSDPTHGGGIVYKEIGGVCHYLLVESSRARGTWVLPKGHIRRGESPAETAVREVREEAGVWARVEKPLGMVPFEAMGELIRVQFYLMAAVDEEQPSEARQHQWLNLEKALDRLPQDTGAELRGAHELILQARKRAIQQRRSG